MTKTTKFLAILAVFVLLTVFYGCAMNDIETKGARTNFNDEHLEPAEPAEPVEEPTEPKRGTFPDLDWETELRIKQDFYNTHFKPWGYSFSPDLLKIDCYLGTYNGYVALMIGHRFFLEETQTIIVAGYSFFYPNAQQIEVWKLGEYGEIGNFYLLTEAYNLGFLTGEDIKNIHDKRLDPYAWNPPRFR